MTKTLALTIWTSVSKVMSLLFNMPSRFVIAFLPRIKHLLIWRLQSLSGGILELKKIKSVTASNVFLFYLPRSDGTRGQDLSFFECWVLSQLFHSPISPSSSSSSSSLPSAIRVESSAYRRLLFHLAILITTCDSSSLAFPMMYSAYKLNKQGDNIPWCTLFPISNQVLVPCPVLTVASWPAHRFCRRQVRWSGIPISWRIIQFVVIHTKALW